MSKQSKPSDSQERRVSASLAGYAPSPGVMAKEMELTLCEFGEDCDFCEPTAPEAKTWAAISYGEETETSYYVCENCLPAKYDEHCRELQYWEDYARAEEKAHN